MLQMNVNLLDELESLAHNLGAQTIYFPYIQQRNDDILGINNREKYQYSINWIFNKSSKYKNRMIRFAKTYSTVCNSFPRSLTITAGG